jgi:hypothetical protein
MRSLLACPPGQVLVSGRCQWCQDGLIEMGGACVSGTACGSGQWAYQGRCKNCPFGQVPKSFNDRSTCVWCPDGTVKEPPGDPPPANPDTAQPADATCVAAHTKCGTAQWGYQGRCRNCAFGQVPKAPTDRSTCVWCPDGTVKEPPGDPPPANPDTAQPADATCIPADCVCNCGSWGYQGRCIVCGINTTPNPTRSGCVRCPDGKTSVDGVCKSGTCPSS